MEAILLVLWHTTSSLTRPSATPDTQLLLVVGRGCLSWPASPRKRRSCQPASFFTSVF